MRTPVVRVVVTDTAERLAALEPAVDDLRQAGVIAELVTEVGRRLRRGRGAGPAGGVARSGLLVGEGVEVVLAGRGALVAAHPDGALGRGDLHTRGVERPP